MPAGRPRIEIDQKQFEKLCAIMCTLKEIAGFFDCSEDTIERWCKREFGEKFADVYEKKSATGKISLRRSQFQLAQNNATMAIWLGKQYLGQKEATFKDITLSGDDGFLKALNDTAKNDWKEED